MKREEILAKAQKEGSDEMEIQIRDRSMRWTYLTMVLTAAVFAFLRQRRGEPMMDLCVTVCASVVVGQLYRFFKTRDTGCLVLGLVTLMAGILGLVRYCMGH